MSGFNCSNCTHFVPHGTKHTQNYAEQQCKSVTEIGVELYHAWPRAGHIKVLHGHNTLVKQQPFPPIDIHRKRLQDAARELAGVNGHLESYRHHEDEEYVTVELIVRKDRA